MLKVVEMDYSYLVEMEVPELPVFPIANVTDAVNQIRKDIELWHELLVDADKGNNVALVIQLSEELTEMKEIVLAIERPEIHRHLRLVANSEF